MYYAKEGRLSDCIKYHAVILKHNLSHFRITVTFFLKSALKCHFPLVNTWAITQQGTSCRVCKMNMYMWIINYVYIMQMNLLHRHLFVALLMRSYEILHI